jgi:photosynthetic reaction center H subunit
MIRGAITSYIDVAQITLYVFWTFFACLILYLRGEDRREGYPLESEVMGRPKDRGFLFIPTPKIFRREGGEEIAAPNFVRDPWPANAAKVEPWPGAPLQPIGNPMLAGVGPGSYALRADVAEKMHDGRNVLAPLRIATNFAVAAENVSPIGFEVVGADRQAGGIVKDIWVDQSEVMLRYYEVAVGAKSVLLPVNFSDVNSKLKRIVVEAILGDQFADVPVTKASDEVTKLEEEKVMAYYGAGTLYATPERSEPLL